MIEEIINSLVPIFAIMGIGYLAGKIRSVDNHNVSQLNTFVMNYALPATLFASTAKTPHAVLEQQWPLMLALVVSMLVLYALCFTLQRRVFGLSTSEAAVQTLTISLPNYAAAGLPLIAAVFGDAKLIYVALSIAAGSIFPSPITLAILEVDKAKKSAGGAGGAGAGLVIHAFGRSLMKPIVLGPILGIATSLLNIPMPHVVISSLTLLGQAAGGAALFVTGLVLSAQALSFSGNVISGTILKNAIHPLLVLALIRVLPMSPETARAALLLAALPSGFFGILFGLNYGVQSREAGSTLVVSSLVSAATLAVALILTT